MVDREVTRRLAVLLHADVVGSAELVRTDETIAHQRIRDVFRRFSETISAHGGKAHEIRGDALIAEFGKASDAVSASIAFQESNATHNRSLKSEVVPVVRIGIAMGEVVIADNTVTGEGIVLAQRLEQLAEPGGTVIQGAAYETVPKRLPFIFESLGELALKGFDEPVKAYAVTPKPGSRIPEPETDGELFGPGRPAAERPTIAVLAFENMSGDPEQKFLAEGISEDLITALSKIRSFLVIDRNSSFSYKSQIPKISLIAEELGVRYVLEGSVRKARSRVRITAQLTDASAGSNVWAERYDRDIEDIFALQDEIALTIVSAVDSEIGAAERRRALRKPPDSLDAWETYQRGLWHLWRFAVEDIGEAIRSFRAAQELDPEFAPAFAYEGYAHYVNVIQGYVEDVDVSLDKAMIASRKAASLDPGDAVAHFALGRVYTMRGEHDAAISSLQESVSLNPSMAQAHHGLGWALLLSGKLEEAISELLMAIQLSPRDPRVWATMVFLSLANCLEHRYQEAADWARKAAQVPTNAGYWSSATLAAALANMNRISEARQALDKALRLKPDLTLSYLTRTLPVSEPGALEPYLQGLRVAGLPE